MRVRISESETESGRVLSQSPSLADFSPQSDGSESRVWESEAGTQTESGRVRVGESESDLKSGKVRAREGSGFASSASDSERGEQVRESGWFESERGRG